MFDNNLQNNDEETSFSEAYKSQILNDSSSDEQSNTFLKIIIILGLVAIILGLGIYGYQYITESKEAEKSESAAPALPKAAMLDNIEELEEEAAKEEVSIDENSSATETSQKDMEQIANEVKEELAKEIDKEESSLPVSKSIEAPKVSTQKGEDTYLEQLAELSKEIDGEE
ncbi:MAG: hypothetical protein K0U38_03315 [Epsilonproteobacteria bacterium]|nr:hypothetical protein [Campylobacterota bacterium]